MRRVVFILFIAVMAVACANDVNRDLTPEQMSGWKANGLQGQVKQVKYGNGVSQEYDSAGNLLRELRGGDEVLMREYYSPTRYRVGDDIFDVVFTDGNIRKERWNSGTAEDIGVIYKFDEYGRLDSYDDQMSYADDSYEYHYAKKSDVLPMSMTEYQEMDDGSVATTYEYKYLEKDSIGNWTKRKVVKTVKSVRFDYVNDAEELDTKIDEYVETAEYVYF